MTSDKTPFNHSNRLQIKPGAMVAFVGMSGSGKSTITNLLMRHYETKNGMIKIDGHPIEELEIGELRNLVN